MTVNNPPKLLVLMILVIGMIILVAIDRVSFSDATPIFTLVVGYLIGNGVAARRNEPVEPVLKQGSNHD